MDWIKPKFSQDHLGQPKKKQRLENNSHKSGFRSSHSQSKHFLSSKGLSWIDKYAPSSKIELNVHKKKIEEVEFWLKSLREEGVQILLLTGPPGSGKLTTLKVLCRDLKIQYSEWITPPRQEYDPDTFNQLYCSQQRSFEEFIIRGSRYSSVLSSSPSKRIVVVKDIPNVFVKDPLIFHEFLSKMKTCNGLSIVFIIAENSLALDLFPECIKSELVVKTIHFNPVTKKSITATLTNIIRKENIGSIAMSKIISEISETCNGDLRNAVISLNFASTHGTRSKQKFENKSSSKVDAAKESSLSLPDPSVDLFHGLGRVLYTKRNEDSQLSHNPNMIVDSFISSTNTFINMLQENYLNIFSDISSASQAANYLSLSDFLLSDVKNDNQLSRDLSLSTAVRGIMYSNRDPIKKFQQFNKSKYMKAMELSKSFSDCVKASFYCSNPKTVLLDSIFLHKMSKNLNESQRNVVKDLSCFYLMEKNYMQ